MPDDRNTEVAKEEEGNEGEPLLELEVQHLSVDQRTFDPMDLTPKMRQMHEVLSLRAQIEAAIFASPKPMRAADLVNLVSHPASLKDIEAQIADLKEEYATRDGGFTLEYVKGLGYQFQSVTQAAPLMEKLFATRPRPMSRAALETLSIIAYRQPCTRAVVEFIRGVDSGSIIKGLLERDLIKCTGRKEDAGRPMLFGTTDEFLHVFGVRSLDELPPLQAFQPTSETMQQSLSELEELEKQVDVEQFVADESEEMPGVSSGLLAVNVAAEEPIAADPHAVYEESEVNKQGALAADEDGEDELAKQNQDTEMDSPDGDILTAGGREVGPGGADLS